MNKPIIYIIDLRETGKNIERLRIEQGYSARDIAQIMGFDTTAAYYHWKNGKTLPSIEHLLVLSELFEKHIEDIIIWTRPPPLGEGRMILLVPLRGCSEILQSIILYQKKGETIVDECFLE